MCSNCNGTYYDKSYRTFFTSAAEHMGISNLTGQKQPPEVFCKKRCSKKFPKIHRKTPVPEPLFKYSCRLQACNFIKKESLTQVFPCEFYEISKNTFFTEHL